MTRRALAVLLAMLALPPGAALAQELAAPPIETPSLASEVERGALPPIAERLPERPVVVELSGPERSRGVHGGALDLLMASDRDTRMMVVYGYARLIGYNQRFVLEPDILEGYEVEAGRIFTFHLRKRLRWSDGHPFTAEDFRYYFEDVATSETVRNESLPIDMIVEGQRPRFEVIDEHTVRYAWSRPNPSFLAQIAGARPLYLYRPAHYLKQFHAAYADPDALEKKVAASGQRNWEALHYVMGQQYKNQNPDLPTLQPWVLTTRPPAKRFVFKRNPYFHRIDHNGRQLPYIDEVRLDVTNTRLIPIKTGSGESDLQARGLNFSNFTVLKRSEEQFGYRTELWKTAQGARWALFPNLNTVDDDWRRLFRDVRFRRALSLAVNRHEINQVIYYGLAREAGNFVLPESPLYDREQAKRWTDFDVAEANRLLDAMGLTERDGAGTRLMADGRPLELTVVFATEDSEPADLLELIRDSWARIGIRVYSKPLAREVLRTRVFSGHVKMAMWSGHENGIPTVDTGPNEFAPTSQLQLQWPKWGQYVETRGRAGTRVDLPAAAELFALNERWRTVSSDAERREIWERMLDIYSDQVFSIGLIASVPQVVVVNRHLRNVPESGIYNWDPGAHFGLYRPDTFWFADPQSGT